MQGHYRLRERIPIVSALFGVLERKNLCLAAERTKGERGKEYDEAL